MVAEEVNPTHQLSATWRSHTHCGKSLSSETAPSQGHNGHISPWARQRIHVCQRARSQKPRQGAVSYFTGRPAMVSELQAHSSRGSPAIVHGS